VTEPSLSSAPAADAAAPKSRNSYLTFAIRGGFGLAIVALLLWRYDARPILRAASNERPAFFIAAVALYLGGQIMSAWRWQWLARLNSLPGPYREYLKYYFIGVFTNLFVPGLIGGDAARAVYLGRRHRRLTAAVASVIADRGAGLLALFWFAAIAALWLPMFPLPATIRKVVWLLGGGTFIGWLLAPLITHSAPGWPVRLKDLVTPLIPYLERPGAMLPAIALSLVLQASLAGCQYLLALGLGLATPLPAFIVCVPIANVLASLPLTLNGLGLRETAYLVLLGGVGVAKPDAIALGLLWFAATMTGGLTGIVAFATTHLPPAGSKA